MKIGNIVSTTKISVSDDFNVVGSLDEIIQGLPTLIIGWDFVNKYFLDFDVITKKIDENTSWTFKKTENRSQHEEDIYNFKEKVYKSLVSNIQYIYIDPVLSKKKTIKKIISKIKSINSIISYHHGSMIYIYGDNLIFGLDLNIIEFMGLKPEKIRTKIKMLSDIFLTENPIFIEYKKMVENLNNQVKFIPVLYSIKNG